MIEQIKYWRKSINKLGDDVERRYRLKHFYSSTLFKIEQDCFLGFFSVRKMLESNAIDKLIINHEYEITSYRKKKNQRKTNHFLHAYDMFHGEKEQLTIKEIANQFIHSNYFSPFVPFERNVMGFYVVSDNFVKKKVYYIPLYYVISIFKSVAYNKIIVVNVRGVENGEIKLIHNIPTSANS